MPTYDYACGACGAQVEFFQSITESAKRKCPTCGKLKLMRQIGTGAGILFKGSGFYETDYRSDSYKKAAKDDKPSEAKKDDSKPTGSVDQKPDSKSDKKSDSKPEKKSD